MNKDYRKYMDQKKRAKQRNIEFKLTFEQWFEWWLSTGKYHLRGCRKGNYVMARKGDQGAYELGNIECITTEENTINAQKGRKHSEASIQKMRKPKSEITREKMKQVAQQRGNNGVMDSIEARKKLSEKMTIIWAERKRIKNVGT